MVGYVYVTQIEDTFHSGDMPQNEDMLVYKLTKTMQPKATLDNVVFFAVCEDHSKAKKAISNALKAKFLYRRDLGTSCFEGSVTHMVKHICETLGKLDSYIGDVIMESTTANKKEVTPTDNKKEAIPTDITKPVIMEDILDEEVMEAAILGQESEDEYEIREQYDLIIKTRQTVWYEHDAPPEIDYDNLVVPEIDGNRLKVKKEKKAKPARVYTKIRPTQVSLPQVSQDSLVQVSQNSLVQVSS